MSGSRLRTFSRRMLLGGCALALPLGLTACLPGLKDAPPVAEEPLPTWEHLNISLPSQPVGNPATGWVTTVTVPRCFKGGIQLTSTGTASSGTLVPNGTGFNWTRVVTGSPPVTAPSATFTLTCVDGLGRSAHPDLVVTAPPLP
jgi:hypothetical protein